MSTRSGPPSSIDGIKRLAKKIASEKFIKHTAALNEAARAAGYQNFLNAKRQLSRGSHAPRNDVPNSTTRTSRNMTVSDFHAKARSEWIAKINMNVPAGDHSRTWTTPHSIAEVLQPFMGSSANHGHLPTGGGFDFLNVSLSHEPGCLEFGVSGSTFLLAKPRRLVLERIDRDAAQSFLMLELEDLDPSGVMTTRRIRGCAIAGTRRW